MNVTRVAPRNIRLATNVSPHDMHDSCCIKIDRREQFHDMLLILSHLSKELNASKAYQSHFGVATTELSKDLEDQRGISLSNLPWSW